MIWRNVGKLGEGVSGAYFVISQPIAGRRSGGQMKKEILNICLIARNADGPKEVNGMGDNDERSF